MSYQHVRNVLERSRSRNAARVVLLVLADRAGNEGQAYPSLELLMREANVGKTAAHEALQRLVELGELRIDYNAGPRGCNVYHLHLPLPESGGVPESGPLPESGQGGTGKRTKPLPESGPKPSGNHQEPYIASSPKAADTKFSSAMVEGIYQAYPRKKAPVVAKKAIVKHLGILAKRGTPEPATWLLSRVQAFARSRHGEDEQFTPYPATWFNAGRYDEDFTASPRGLNGTGSSPKPIGSMSARIAALQHQAS